MQGGKDLEGFFAFNAQQPLEAPGGRLSILVDETSMVDMSLASSLLDAIPTHIPVQLVIVGEQCTLHLELQCHTGRLKLCLCACWLVVLCIPCTAVSSSSMPTHQVEPFKGMHVEHLMREWRGR